MSIKISKNTSLSTETFSQLHLPFTAEGEASLYLDMQRCDNRSHFALLQQKPGSNKKSQTMHPTRLMPEVIRALRKDRDSWISQAEFFAPTRRLVHLKRIGLSFADLDTYKVGMDHLSPEYQAQALLDHCANEGIIAPSLVVHSGRGLQAKWLYEGAIPARALPRWNAVEKALQGRFRPFGADPGALSATQVLRLVNTINTRSGLYTKVLWPPPGTEPQRWGFDNLADEFLPIARQELEQLRKSRKKRADGKWSLAINTRRLAWDRFYDIQLLMQLREWDISESGVPVGHRNTVLWLLTCFLARALDPPFLGAEVRALARLYCPTFTSAEVRGCATTTIRRAFQAFNGERTSWNGRPCDPRYKFKNSTLIELLEINSDEERQLKTIISQDERLRRKRIRDTQRRRKAGQVRREEYIAAQKGHTIDQRAKVLQYRRLGWAQKKIAEHLGVSERQVKRWCSTQV